jgi:hypothetical protein
VHHRLGTQNYCDHGDYLHRLVRRHAKRAILIDLAVGVGMGNVNNPGEQHQRNADDPQD